MRRELSPAASFWVSAGVVAHTLWTSAAPAMVYPLYAQQWHLTPTITTAIFAIYPLTVVTILVMFGTLSDRLGGRLAMLYGVALSTAGVLLFAVAENLPTLFIGRILMGIGVGLSAGASAAALADYAGEGGVGRASSTTLVAQAAGFAAALLAGGALAQYAPYPTRLSFFLLLGLLSLLLLGVIHLPRPRLSRPAEGRAGWGPVLPQVPPDLRGPFRLAAVTVMTAYAHGVLFTSLGAQIARDLVQSTNLLVNGAALALFPITLGGVGLLARHLPAGRAILWGAVISVISMGFLAAAVLWHSLASFVAASVMAGAGYSLMVYGGFAVISAAAPAGSRGGMMSAALVGAYLFTGLLALTLGKVATGAGMTTASLAGAAVMALLSAAVAIFAMGKGRQQASRHISPADQLSA